MPRSSTVAAPSPQGSIGLAARQPCHRSVARLLLLVRIRAIGVNVLAREARVSRSCEPSSIKGQHCDRTLAKIKANLGRL